jgi:hypothetical protein
MKIVLFTLLIFLIHGSSNALNIWNKSFNECVNDGKIGRSDNELSLHINACAQKYPEPSNIFNQNGKNSTCWFENNNGARFFISLNKNNNSTISNFSNFKTGKLRVHAKDFILINFVNSNESMSIKLSNRGHFTLTQGSNEWTGQCSN